MGKLTNEQFIKKCKLIHGDKYDYSLIEYKNAKTKVKIICKIHGIFEQSPNSHLSGHGCSLCKSFYQRIPLDSLINDFIKIHGNKYDYSLVNYINKNKTVKIICKKHGIFKQTPNNHLSGNGCSKCIGNNKLTTDEFIKNCIKIHGDKYDYSLVEYKNNIIKVKIICKKHGIFEQSPQKHLRGNNCPLCSKEQQKLTKSDFIKNCIKIHGDKYDYSLVNYINNNTKVKIICKEHGVFEQTPSNHTHITLKQGCPNCRESKGENEIKNILNRYGIHYKSQKTFNDCKSINKLKFDFYLPDYNTCIEFDGEQHFKPVSIWGGEKGYNEIINRDKIKNEYCKQNNILLIRIRYNENIEEKLKNILNNQKL